MNDYAAELAVAIPTIVCDTQALWLQISSPDEYCVSLEDLKFECEETAKLILGAHPVYLAAQGTLRFS